MHIKIESRILILVQLVAAFAIGSHSQPIHNQHQGSPQNHVANGPSFGGSLTEFIPILSSNPNDNPDSSDFPNFPNFPHVHLHQLGEHQPGQAPTSADQSARNDQPAAGDHDDSQNSRKHRHDANYRADREDDSYQDEGPKPRLYKAIERIYIYPRYDDETDQYKNQRTMNNDMQMYSMPESGNYNQYQQTSQRHFDDHQNRQPKLFNDVKSNADEQHHRNFNPQDQVQNGRNDDNSQQQHHYQEYRNNRPPEKRDQRLSGSPGDNSEGKPKDDEIREAEDALEEAKRFERFLENLRTFSSLAEDDDDDKRNQNERESQNEQQARNEQTSSDGQSAADEQPTPNGYLENRAQSYHSIPESVYRKHFESVPVRYEQYGSRPANNENVRQADRRFMGEGEREDENDDEDDDWNRRGHRSNKNRRRGQKASDDESSFDGQNKDGVGRLINSSPEEKDYGNVDILREMERSGKRYLAEAPAYSREGQQEMRRVEKLFSKQGKQNANKQRNPNPDDTKENRIVKKQIW